MKLQRLRACAVLCSIFLFYVVRLCNAGSGGLPGYQLQLFPGTRLWGMGQSGSASATDITSLFLNPAVLAKVDQNQFYLSHQDLWGFADYGFVGYAHPTLGGIYALGFSQVSSGSIDEMDQYANKTGTFSDVFRVLYFAYGAKLTKFISIGFTTKGLSHAFADYFTYGYAFNGGILVGPVKHFYVGFSGSDIYGREIKEKNVLQNFPMIKRIGLAYRPLNEKLTIALDYQTSAHISGLLCFGAEYCVKDRLALRLGREGSNNTVGIGIKFGGLNLDFAVVEHELGTRNLFSLSHSFGSSISQTKKEIKEKKKTSQELLTTGIKQYKEQKYQDASETFKKALVVQPDNKKALKWQIKTNDLVSKFKLAQDAFSLNKYERAMVFANQSLQIEPSFKAAEELKKKARQRAITRRSAEQYYKSGLDFEKQDLIKDATEMWQKTLEVDSEHAGAIAKLEAYGQLEPLKCEISDIQDVFTSMYKYYASNPFGKITIKNSDKTVLKNVEIKMMIQKYFDFPTVIATLSTIPGDTIIEIPIKAVFNNVAMTLTEDTRVSAEITVSYNFRRRPIEQKLVTSFTLYSRNVIKWDDSQKVASFITPKDPVVRSFVNDVLQLIDTHRYPFLPKAVVQAIALYDGLATIGIRYRPDPNNPYSENYSDRNRIDIIWYPRETLQQRSGDCDDLTVLYCSLLEAVGINTKVIDVPGHIFMAFDTGVKSNEANTISSKKENYLVYDDHVWLPIETTQVTEGFFRAWQTAMNEFKEVQY